MDLFSILQIQLVRIVLIHSQSIVVIELTSVSPSSFLTTARQFILNVALFCLYPFKKIQIRFQSFFHQPSLHVTFCPRILFFSFLMLFIQKLLLDLFFLLLIFFQIQFNQFQLFSSFFHFLSLTEPPISTPNCPRLYGIFPHNSNCRTFYSCWNGEASKYECPPGLAYDADQRVCVWADLVERCDQLGKFCFQK